MRALKKIASVLIFSIAPAISFAFDADVKQLARSEGGIAVANNFSRLIDISDYGGCSLAMATALGVWGAKKMPDRDAQVTWEVMRNGLDIYRRDFIKQYGTDKPLRDVITQLSGAYFNFNSDTIIQRCVGLVDRAIAEVEQSQSNTTPNPNNQQRLGPTFQTLDGSYINMADLKGRAVLVKFWATSCTTSEQQMKDTQEYFEKYNASGLEVIAVAMSYDPVSFVSEYAASRKLPFTIAIDQDGLLAKTFGDVRLTPTTLLIDRNGKIIKRYVGNYDKKDMLRSIETAIRS